jgi:hypothetical protein
VVEAVHGEAAEVRAELVNVQLCLRNEEVREARCLGYGLGVFACVYACGQAGERGYF